MKSFTVYCIYLLYIQNVYGCHFWSKYKQHSYKHAVVAINNIYRNLFGILGGESLSAIYVNNNIDSFGVLLAIF